MSLDFATTCQAQRHGVINAIATRWLDTNREVSDRWLDWTFGATADERAQYDEVAKRAGDIELLAEFETIDARLRTKLSLDNEDQGHLAKARCALSDSFHALIAADLHEASRNLDFAADRLNFLINHKRKAYSQHRRVLMEDTARELREVQVQLEGFRTRFANYMGRLT